MILEFTKKLLTLLLGITAAAFTKLIKIRLEANIAKTKPIKESKVFKNGKGKRTIRRKLPIIPNKNTPKEHPSTITVIPESGFLKNPKLVISFLIIGSSAKANEAPTNNPIILSVVLKIPRLNPIKPTMAIKARTKISIMGMITKLTYRFFLVHL
jgi:hypothetical protein